MSLPTLDSNFKSRSLQLNRKSSKPVTLHLLHEFEDPHLHHPKVLEGLGKATKRGVRTCPKCGVTNGTRGLKCKNGDCKYDFKQLATGAINHSSCNKILACDEDIAAELSTKFRVLRLLSEEKLYSVEKISGSSGDFGDWGFVYLPLMEEVNEIAGMEGRDAVAYQLMAFCYMRDCIASSLLFTGHVRGKKRKLGDMLQQEQLCCDHVKASFLAKDCINSICHIDSFMFDSISLPKEMGFHLSQLTSTGSEGNPMVQKLSDTTYIVRGLQDKSHPIGYTYVFYSNQNEQKDQDVFSQPSFDNVCLTCWCGLKLDLNFLKEPLYQPCLQLCTCLLALSSDPKHSKQTYSLLTAMDDYYKHVNLVQESLFTQDAINDSADSSHPDLSGEIEKQATKVEPILDEDVVIFLQKNSKANQKQEEPLFVKGKLDDNLSVKEERLLPSFGHIITDGQLPLISISDSASDSTEVNVPFNEWMAFVMESIEETMHYQCNGRPPPLLFQINHKFFNVVLQRITSSSHKKKRLPDSIETISILPPRLPPHGTFNKYTWKLHNANHVQQIFSISSIRLPLCRCFVENKDGTYSKFEKTQSNGLRQTYGKPPIQPFHLKTQLKIGYDPEDTQCAVSTPFIIEWIPDLYKRSKVGEMRLTFQFNHYRHGKLV